MPITAITAEPIVGDIQPDLAITSALGEHIRGNYVLVRITDDTGRVGLGEASVTSVWSGETQAGTIALVCDVLAPLLLGADPFDRPDVFRPFVWRAVDVCAERVSRHRLGRINDDNHTLPFIEVGPGTWRDTSCK